MKVITNIEDLKLAEEAQEAIELQAHMHRARDRFHAEHKHDKAYYYLAAVCFASFYPILIGGAALLHYFG